MNRIPRNDLLINAFLKYIFYFRSVHTTNDYGVGSTQVLSSVGTNEPVLKVEQYNYTTYDKPVYKVEQYKIQTEGTKTFIPSYTIASNRFCYKIYIIKQNQLG